MKSITIKPKSRYNTHDSLFHTVGHGGMNTTIKEMEVASQKPEYQAKYQDWYFQQQSNTLME